MTYFQFHLAFTLPFVAILAVCAWRQGALTWRRGAYLALIAVIALVYTTPWDNLLVWKGVWGYSPGRVMATIGYVPIEEYLFFLVQPMLTGLWLFWFCRDRRARAAWERSGPIRIGGALLFALVTGAGVAMLFSEQTLYMGLILAWAGPILLFQWAYGGHYLWTQASDYLLAVGGPTLYLWGADRIAIELGIWNISEQFTTGFHLLGLPIEEAVFFLVTNMMVVQGLLLAEWVFEVRQGPIFGRMFSSRRTTAAPGYAYAHAEPIE
ncbi:MAG: lycopene cyclase domain-containing protein [Bacteroidetes bacterium]|jgi:lycopene cyclase domain-containing protein|nr:lycopene cyclase domain-containing protein [Bacteroidota bacterium]